LRDSVCVRRVIGHKNPLQTGDQLAKDLHPLRSELDVQIGGPRDIPTGVRQAPHETQSYRIASADEDDGDSSGRHLGGFCRIPPFSRYDDVDAELYEIAGSRGKFGRISLRKPHADHEVLVFSVSKLLKTVA
jgi:hypothetical protein